MTVPSGAACDTIFLVDQRDLLKQRLAEARVSLAILFGSRAGQRANAASDWDVAVLGAASTDLDRLSATLERDLGGRVDLVDLSRADPLLCMEVVRGGIVLVDRTGSEFARFASLSLRRYEDTKKLRAAQRASLDVFLEQRGLR
jgi:predicted nucleotidyltransferase